jgi:Activator of Hsp90 ATPase, N-terminal
VRKGKLIASYELDVRAAWAGKLAESGAEVRGSVQLPYISEVQRPATNEC